MSGDGAAQCGRCGLPARPGCCASAGAMLTVLETTVATINGCALRGGTERALQDGIAAELARAGLEVLREARLSDRDRVDIGVIVPDPATPGAIVGVEVKLESATVPVFRQLQRYASHDRVLALVLATASRRLALSFGGYPTIGDRPLRIAHVRRF